MNKQMVLCPNKECNHEFPTRKEETQCWKCKERFNSLENLLYAKKSQKVVIKQQSEKQIKKIDELLTKLSSKYAETGVTIQQIQNIAKEVLQK